MVFLPVLPFALTSCSIQLTANHQLKTAQNMLEFVLGKTEKVNQTVIQDVTILIVIS